MSSTANNTCKGMTMAEIQSKYWIICNAWRGSSAILWFDTKLEAELECANLEYRDTGCNYQVSKGVA